jgi:predicted Zn-dependent protease
MELSPDKLLEIGWDGVIGVVETFKNEGYRNADKIILNGDITVLGERMAIANSNGLNGSDQTTILKSLLTTMIEAKGAKGCGWSVGTSLDNFSAYDSGVQAARSAIRVIDPKTIETGEYPVILGPQATTDIINLLAGHSKLDMIDFAASINYQKHGEKMFDKSLSVYDDGSVLGYGGSKGITCEGLPTGKTELIKNGKVVGYLTNDYFMKKVMSKPEKLKEVFGVSDPSEIKLAPRNGFRFQTGGRAYEMAPGIFTTNLFIPGDPSIKEEDLIKGIKKGVLINRTWYLYPVGGHASPEFTGTVIGDSYIIENGEIVAPLEQNSLRIQDSLTRIFGEGNILGITGKAIPTMLWNSEGIVDAPYICLKSLNLQRIGKYE